MIAVAPDILQFAPRTRQTLSGSSVQELHDRLWSSAGVRVVRRGAGPEAIIAPLLRAEAYLLLDAHALVTFPIELARVRVPRGVGALLFIRLSGGRRTNFLERVIIGPQGEFHRFERNYFGGRVHHGTCAMTCDANLAREWQKSLPRAAWRRLRRHVSAQRRAVCSIAGRLFDASISQDVIEFEALAVASSFQRPHANEHGGRHVPGKRAFDVVFAFVGLLLTLPLYPIVMLAIWLEDGRPFFYGHAREGRGARQFSCWKLRSMRKDADRMKARLRAANQADGPQFFIRNDPRLTRVGAFLRSLNLDELPQFWNVLRGDMSVVGPRPSPYAENQFCPEWREARLSVRPGITGLWQVRRTRRAGNDFQEWIKYDIEYVDSADWRLELRIIARTIACFLTKKSGGR